MFFQHSFDFRWMNTPYENIAVRGSYRHVFSIWTEGSTWPIAANFEAVVTEQRAIFWVNTVMQVQNEFLTELNVSQYFGITDSFKKSISMNINKITLVILENCDGCSSVVQLTYYILVSGKTSIFTILKALEKEQLVLCYVTYYTLKIWYKLRSSIRIKKKCLRHSDKNC